MPKCPKCGEETNWLECFYNETRRYDFRLSEYEEWVGEPVYIFINTVNNLSESQKDFYCPTCQELLFEDEDLALSWLKGCLAIEV